MYKKIAIIYDNKKCFTNEIAKYIEIGIKESKNIEVYKYESNFIIKNLNILKDKEGIIIGSPTYFGNVSTNIKKFMDSTLEIWKKREWKNKISAGFTHSYSLNGDKLSTLISIFLFAQQHGMIWKGLDLKSNERIMGKNLNSMGSWVGLMAKHWNIKNNRDENCNDKETVKYFGKSIANLVNNINI